jgi:hypothetical protein
MNRLPAKSRALWRALIGGAAAVAALSAPLAQAQNAGAYPTKPIRLVIPFAPGGSTDILGRLLAQKMGENMQATVVVDNKPGANGTIGCDLVAKAPPDGYTVILGDVGCMSMAPGLYTKLPYDPLRDFAPVSLVGRSPLVLTVGENSPLRSLPRRPRPASSTTPRPARAARTTWAPSCTPCRPRSRSATSPTRAARRRWCRSWRARRTSASSPP